MKKNKTHKRSWLACIALLAGDVTLGCDFQPKTELEEVYCELEDRGASQGLPSIFEFRKNPPQTQALLLKKPAQRMGIKMPSPGEAKATSPPDTPAAAAEPVIRDKQEPPVSATGGIANPLVNNGLDDCRLNRERIVCGAESYILQTNLQNRQLAAHALDENRLLLPARTALEYRDKNVQYYLSSIYPYYLEKMLEIGLGDATMSYTKFAATYDDITQRGESFTGRFAKMYELLKTERKSNAVKARYNDNFPASISQCMRASRALLVCDDIQQNWIYRKQ